MLEELSVALGIMSAAGLKGRVNIIQWVVAKLLAATTKVLGAVKKAVASHVLFTVVNVLSSS